VIAKPLFTGVFTVLGAVSIHSITGLSLGISPLRMLRDSTHEGKESRQRIIEHLKDNPKHFSALRSDLQMGKGQLRRHLDILIESGTVVETEVKNRKEYSIFNE
jgi:predicted transcriptional regulator